MVLMHNMQPRGTQQRYLGKQQRYAETKIYWLARVEIAWTIYAKNTNNGDLKNAEWQSKSKQNGNRKIRSLNQPRFSVKYC